MGRARRGPARLRRGRGPGTEVPAGGGGARRSIGRVTSRSDSLLRPLLVFGLFSFFYLKEGLKWNHGVSFVLILSAVYFAVKKFD